MSISDRGGTLLDGMLRGEWGDFGLIEKVGGFSGDGGVGC